MRAGKRSLLTLSVSFDASLSDIGVALISGATLVVEKRTVVSQPRELLATIRKTWHYPSRLATCPFVSHRAPNNARLHRNNSFRR